MSSGRIQLELVGTGSIQTALGDRRKFRTVIFPTGPRGRDGSVAGSITWDAVTGKPSTFPPASHTHTKSEVGLSAVDNTSDLNKPVSTLQAAADTAVATAAAADASAKAAAARTLAEATAASALASHVAASDPHPGYATDGELTTGLAGKSDTGHTHTRDQVGLSNVDNTSDLNKPVSTLQAAADTAVATAASNALASHVSASDPHPGWSIPLARLAPSGAVNGQLQQYNGTQWVPVTLSIIGGSTGGTNNAVLVANGTAGATLQSRTGVTIDASNNLAVSGNITGFGRLNVGSGNANGPSVALGTLLNPVAAWAICVGVGAQSDHQGGISGGGQFFSGYGDNMWVIGNVCRAVANDTPSELFENGSSIRWATPSSTSGTFLAVFTARTSNAGGKSLHAVRLVFYRRLSTAASITVFSQAIGTDTQADGSAWPAGTALAIDADTTNGTIRFRFTGEPATNYRSSIALYGNQVGFL